MSKANVKFTFTICIEQRDNKEEQREERKKKDAYTYNMTTNKPQLKHLITILDTKL